MRTKNSTVNKGNVVETLNIAVRNFWARSALSPAVFEGLQYVTYVAELRARLRSTARGLRAGCWRFAVNRATCGRVMGDWRRWEMAMIFVKNIR